MISHWLNHLDVYYGTIYKSIYRCYHILEASAVTRLRAMAVFEPEGRPNCLPMKSPADMSFPISTLVLIPSPFSMYTTSSVATFPDAPLAYGQPPRPATEESTALIPIYLHAEKPIMSINNCD